MLCFNTTGTGNTGVGHYTLVSNTIGVFNTAVGRNALFCNTTGNIIIQL
jgi:trimeric autotransporter adhesin